MVLLTLGVFVAAFGSCPAAGGAEFWPYASRMPLFDAVPSGGGRWPCQADGLTWLLLATSPLLLPQVKSVVPVFVFGWFDEHFVLAGLCGGGQSDVPRCQFLLVYYRLRCCFELSRPPPLLTKPGYFLEPSAFARMSGRAFAARRFDALCWFETKRACFETNLLSPVFGDVA
ncbi:hypothetical protein Nepgr_019578 [Nepenthes gracilis]|uniref:Secreted protein n=1 Tax=Nepenthes gracilis TaxID=150966 RepID=A0AAD3SVB4_NEPGR|nr:hypothetical protein Nepgr_019578 [Nepenthes gracilis]